MAQYIHNNIKKELVIEAQIKSIINTILENCKKESDSNSLLLPLEDYEDRVAYYTGLQKESLKDLLNKTPTENEEQSYDIIQRVVIMKTLLKFYKNHHLPKFKELFQAVKDAFPDTDIMQFRRTLTSIGFDYKKTVNGAMIAEDAKLTFERYYYLKKIKMLRTAKVHISYLEERYINKELTFNKPDFDKDACYGMNDTTHIWDGFYLYHVLSDMGLEKYFITNKICKKEHNKWVFDNLIKFMIPGCAIVIDNHPLHGELVDDTITQYHRKADMLHWLKKRNIPCSDNMCKAELYELISRCNKPTACYDFDRLLKSHGHEVLRLPTGYKWLSPTTLFWTEVSKNMPSLSAECTAVELEEAIIPALIKTHKTCWKEKKQKVTYFEGILDSLYTETEMALENFCSFDIKNIDAHAKIPEYFYVLDSY